MWTTAIVGGIAGCVICGQIGERILLDFARELYLERENIFSVTAVECALEKLPLDQQKSLMKKFVYKPLPLFISQIGFASLTFYAIAKVVRA